MIQSGRVSKLGTVQDRNLSRYSNTSENLIKSPCKIYIHGYSMIFMVPCRIKSRLLQFRSDFFWNHSWFSRSRCFCSVRSGFCRCRICGFCSFHLWLYGSVLSLPGLRRCPEIPGYRDTQKETKNRYATCRKIKNTIGILDTFRDSKFITVFANK